MQFESKTAWIMGGILCLAQTVVAADAPVSYAQNVAPVLKKYCAGCHNDADREGKFSLESFASLQKGVEDKPVLIPGNAAQSKLWQVVSPGGDPQMPPDGEKAPTADELALLKLWIEQGAAGPSSAEAGRMTLNVPHIESRTQLRPVTALAFSPDGRTVAIGHYGRVEIRQETEAAQPFSQWKTVRTLEGLPGKVESTHFCFDGHKLITASGITGAGGVATLWNLETGERIRDFEGHRDILFDAEVSPDGKLLATCSYDREIILWDLETGKQLRTLAGHNGAVYDIAFSPSGAVLASASADDTCKVWRVRDGERLDTLGQPLKEQYAIEFSRDGQFVVSAGADHQIRVWKLLSEEKPTISPLLVARFAHEAPIVSLAFTPDGTRLITTAEDRTLKFWETNTYSELSLLENQPEIVANVAFGPTGEKVVIGRLDGSTELLDVPHVRAVAAAATNQSDRPMVIPEAQAEKNFDEVEPNGTAAQAQHVELPAAIQGVIHQADQPFDEDLFRFTAKQGVTWVIEVNAARSKSPLDSFIEVLSADGKPVQRALAQAVRESYFTFRGKDGNQTGDFRVFGWEDMSLNELLYCNGEIVKLWRAPRGPDSGFDVYPGEGARWGYLDTCGLTHALNETCYIVEMHPPGTSLIPNGLPQFPIYFVNDDASHREAGKDSKLFFTAPADGDYLLRLRDVRGSQGADFKYKISIRAPKPDFAVTLMKRKLELAPDNRTELRFKVRRNDQYDGPVSIEINGLPPGFSFLNPLVVQEEQIEATSVISVAAGTPVPTPEQVKQIAITAKGTINGVEVTHPIEGFEQILIKEAPTLSVVIGTAEGGATPVQANEGSPLEFEIHPGETIMLKVSAQRNGVDAQIDFGNADCGRNLPHGVYVDNIGLNGLMMLPNQSEQIFFVTASPGVPEQTRLFHLRTLAFGEVATPPIVLHVRKPAARTVAQP